MYRVPNLQILAIYPAPETILTTDRDKQLRYQMHCMAVARQRHYTLNISEIETKK